MNLHASFVVACLLLIVAALAAATAWFRVGSSPRARIAERVRAVAANGTGSLELANETGHPLLRRGLGRSLAMLGERIPIFDAQQRTHLAQQCRRAGFHGQRAVSILIGLKFSAGIGAALGIALFGQHVPLFGQYLLLRVLMMLGAFILGMIVPEYVLAFRARRWQRKIAVALPDALDLLVICTNAGHSLAVGVQRVADEIRMVSAPLADELDLTSSELQLGGDASIALRNLADRVALPSVRSLVATLIQSQQFGTPITTALKTLSKSERNSAMVELEEKAAKLAPKMTMPMMLFILPVVFIIAAGPAVLRLLTVFGK
ncbi:fimbrial protein [Burkholderia sp. WAC0059]|uniref:type II secretion system F family protein n=1 Tax=Burkholderia sp. WAC0059 TaxID=2066022 RepID=UPI000C7E9E3A|nr:type II secretion system F family protein [Burkholderia sp. WAC0059]PLZ03380.1 fimbrial protein [Burkholderia sp. WAC0059]